MSDDTVYLLSISNDWSDGGNLYITDPMNSDRKVDMSMSIKDAKVFHSEQDAWNYRETIDKANWQITRMSAKNLFKRKLRST